MAETLTLSKPVAARRRSKRYGAMLPYALAMVHEFRWTLAGVVGLVALGATLYRMTPHHQFNGNRPDLLTAVYGAWMALLAQPLTPPPKPWYLNLMDAIYPVFGFVLIGEGVVRLALLLMSKRHGEKEWMRVMATTYRDHIVLCGLGHLGYRIFEQFLASDVDVVIIEIDDDNRFLADARAAGACILLRDMKDDQALIGAGIEHARAIVLATDDDMANLEVAMDARRLNKNIRILLRLYDQALAKKIAGALTIDAAFSASALAAPIVAAMSMKLKTLSTTVIGGVPHVVTEMKIEPASPLAGKRIEQIENYHPVRVLARTPADGSPIESPPVQTTTVHAGDVLVLHAAASQLPHLAASGAAIVSA